MKTKDKETMSALVVKDNALINASFNLDLVEQRLILLAIIEARKTGLGINSNDALTVHASNYIETFSVERQTAYISLKNSCRDLFNRQFSFQELTPKGNIINQTSRWVSQIGYVDSEAKVQLIFAPAVVPLITRLEERFTTYDLVQISNLTSKYAVRLYELLMSWRTTSKTPIYKLDDFRKMLGLDCTEYAAMCDFKKHVLEKAITQINKHTDINVNYDQFKSGRTITGFSFSYKVKKVIGRSSVTKMTDAQRHLFANKLSELPDMNKYSQGTESYAQFAVRIAEMLQDKEKFEELLPYLRKVGFSTK